MSGFFGDLSPSQEEALKEMKDTFGDIDDHTALRFLRARQFMVKNAAALYKKYVEYRKESGIEKILRTEVPKTDLFKSFVPHAYHGFDKDGRPIYFEKTGLIDYPTAFRFLDEEDFMRHHLYQMEYQIERCKEGSQMVGKVVDNFCSVVDLTGLNMSHRKALKLIRMWAAHDQDCYPERLGRLYIINAPWIFPTFWKICKIWLDQNTINKIKVLGRNYKSELREVIAEHYIPHEYGGACKCPGGCVAVADISMHKDGASLEEELKDLPEKTISSRECFEVRLQCGPEGGEFQWAFRVAGDKDLSFSVQCESGMLEWSYSSSSLHNLNAAESEKKATDTKKKEVKPRYIVEPERLNSTKGSYVSKGPATIVVKFDNSSSYFTSKTLKFFARVGAPSEDISEEKMAALALTEQEKIAHEQQQANVDDAPTSSDVPASLHASITAQSPVAEPVNVQ